MANRMLVAKGWPQSTIRVGRSRVSAECAVRFEPVRANTSFFAPSTKCFRAG